MKIYLIGYMGCGKSTIGPLLAGRLELPFIDLDLAVEKAAGMSIPEIFEKNGEEYFRREENRILLQYAEDSGAFVMACGGGTACYFGAIEKMNQSGITIFLDTPAGELVQRLHAKRKTRPLLKDANDYELLQLIEEALEKRMPTYEQASMRIHSAQPVWNIVDEIERKLKSGKI